MATDKILIVAHGHPALSPGGAEIAAYAIFEALRETSGVTPLFLAWTGAAAQRRGGTPFAAFRDRDDEILLYSDVFDHFLFSQPTDIIDQFAVLLRRIDPDIIHLHHYSKIGLEFIALARRLRPDVRIIITLHEYLGICHNYGQMVKTGGNALCYQASPHECAACFPDIPPTEFLLRRNFIRAHFDKVDLFIAPSEFLRQRYIAWGLPAWQITTLGNGTKAVDPPRPRTLRPDEGRGAFAFFGQINPFKGLLPLVAAFEHLGRTKPREAAGIHLTIHGANLEYQDASFVAAFTQALARTSAYVRFAGPYARQDIGSLMAAADWVMVPSVWWENAPLVIQEALAHRRPVICSNIGGMAEAVRPGQDGHHVRAGDPFDLAALILRVARDVPAWDRLQTTIRTPPSIAQTVTRLLEVYRERAFSLA